LNEWRIYLTFDCDRMYWVRIVAVHWRKKFTRIDLFALPRTNELWACCVLGGGMAYLLRDESMEHCVLQLES